MEIIPVGRKGGLRQTQKLSCQNDMGRPEVVWCLQRVNTNLINCIAENPIFFTR